MVLILVTVKLFLLKILHKVVWNNDKCTDFLTLRHHDCLYIRFYIRSEVVEHNDHLMLVYIDKMTLKGNRQ